MTQKQNVKFKIILIMLLLTSSIFINNPVSSMSAIEWDKDKLRVDGITLRHKRVINFTHSADVSSLDIDSHHGEYNIFGGDEFNLTVTIYEKKEDDVFLTFEDGYLKAKSRSDSPCAIGSIKGTIPNGINLIIDSGAGNFNLSNFNGLDIDLDIGAGKIDIENCNAENIIIDCGVGSITLSTAKTKSIDIDCGTGSIKFNDVLSKNIKADTGVGAISATDCTIEKANFDTGIGSISTDNCQIKHKNFSTGLGHID